ncbi:DUF1415 family protein [Lewinella sp. 4G2]|uniref:DUF1415 family protein n=1 Tax=Lewinella sp. 4G2 TaxID=1803372 RepID=UPI0007B47A48|nr:DUF1415 domain-containing protein [Lewinella sp. 4G2]OAV46269.1 hypothetical protein A3850_018610 [Lewinella sp. 4G2]
MSPADAVLRWVETFVLRHGLCPFAAVPWRKGLVSAEVLEAEDIETLFYSALSQVQSFVGKERSKVETTLLVVPHLLADFETFLDFVFTFEEALAETGAAELVQLAHFHPDYQFEGLEFEDQANLTNRSPWPVVQLLRVESVAEAVAGHPDVEGIPGRNVARMRSIAP